MLSQSIRKTPCGKENFKFKSVFVFILSFRQSQERIRYE